MSVTAVSLKWGVEFGEQAGGDGGQRGPEGAEAKSIRAERPAAEVEVAVEVGRGHHVLDAALQLLRAGLLAEQES